MRAIACMPFVLVLAACQTPVALQHSTGLYTTHFDGIPDEGHVCALLTNEGERPVTWVRMKLQGRSRFEDAKARHRSYWTFPGALAPGESVAVVLEHPPVLQEMRLEVQRAGTGTLPRGRPVRRAPECSEASLLETIRERNAARTDARVEVRAISLPPR